MKKTHKKLAILALAVIMAVSTLGLSVLVAPQDTQLVFYVVNNPYANVNWATTDLH